jgi:hypothetical protein
MVVAGQRELWLDEAHSAHLAQMTFAQLWEYVHGDVHPPLYFLVLNLWQKISPDTPTALRLLGLAAHLVGAAAFYRLGLTVFARESLAAVGALLFIFSPALVYHAGDARMYSLAVLLAVLLLGATWNFVNAPVGAWAAVRLSVFAALAFYTHYASLFFIAGAFAFLTLRFATNLRILRFVLASGFLFAVLVAPWVPVVLDQRERKFAQRQEKALSLTNVESLTFGALAGEPASPKVAVRAYVENVASIAGVFPASSLIVTAFLALPLVLACAAFTVTVTGQRSNLVLMVSCIAAFVSAGPFVLGLDGRRYLLLLAPLAILALVAGLEKLSSMRIGKPLGGVAAAIIALLYLGGAARVVLRPGARPFETGATFLAAHAHEKDPVFVSALYAQVPLDYYLSRSNSKVRTRGFPRDIYDWWESQDFKGWGGPILLRADVTRFIEQLSPVSPDSRIWLVEYEANHYDPSGQVLRALREDPAWAVNECDLPPGAGSQLAILLITPAQSAHAVPGCHP